MSKPSKPAQKRKGPSVAPTSISSRVSHLKSDERYRLKLATEFNLLLKACTAGKEMVPIPSKLSKYKYICLAYNRMCSFEKKIIEKHGVPESKAKDFIKIVRKKFEDVVNLDEYFYERNFTPEYFTWWDDSNQPGLLEDLNVCFKDKTCIQEQFKKSLFSTGDYAHNDFSSDMTNPCQQSQLNNTFINSSFSVPPSIHRGILKDKTGSENFVGVDTLNPESSCLGNERVSYKKSAKRKKKENLKERTTIKASVKRGKQYLHSIDTNILHQVKRPFSCNKCKKVFTKSAQNDENLPPNNSISNVLSAVFSVSGLTQCETAQTEMFISEKTPFTCDFNAYKQELISMYGSYSSTSSNDSDYNYDITIRKKGKNHVDHGSQVTSINEVDKLMESFSETTGDTTCGKSICTCELCPVEKKLSDSIDPLNESCEALLNVSNRESDIMSPLSSEDLSCDIVNFDVNSDDIEYHSEIFDF